MASTMQAWRTGLSLAKTEMYSKIKELFPSIYDWASVDTSAADQVDYHITDDLFLRVNLNGIIAYNGSSSFVSVNFSTYSNLTVFKAEGCIVLCVESITSPITQYGYMAKMIIDTTDTKNGYSVIYSFSANGTCSLYDNILSTGQTVYQPYNSNSLKTNSSSAQVARYVNNNTGKMFDNLYAVMITPAMNNFVDFNGEKWLFTNGFALPAGDSEPTYTYV